MSEWQLSDEVCSKFVAEYWTKKPVVLKGVVPRGIVEEKDILDALAVCAAARIGDGFVVDGIEAPPVIGLSPMGLYVQGRQVARHEMQKFAPEPGERDLARYIARVAERFDARDIGFVLLDIDRFLPRYAKGLWARIMDFTSGFVSHIGIPGAFAEASCFVGNYALSPFGIHKDGAVSAVAEGDVDNVTFVVRGRKRLLVWPPEYFDDHKNRRRELALNGAEALEKYKPDAVELIGEPGDLMYFPRNYYHVGTDSGDGDVVATFVIGFWHRAHIPNQVSALVKELLSGKMGESRTVTKAWPPSTARSSKLPNEMNDALQVLQELVNSGELRQQAEALWQDHVAQSGFRKLL